MTVINCVCGQRLEAGDVGALFGVLRAHADRVHAEMAITDASLHEMVATRARLPSWDGRLVRLTEPAHVAPLTPACLDDFVGFFEGEAFMDNPSWADCYCMFHHFSAEDAGWSERTGEENRRDKVELIRAGRAHGYLARADGRTVGWCHAAPRAELPRLASGELAVADPEGVGAVVCFVVAAPYRRQGVAGRLLEAACAGFRERGFRWVEGYPRRGESSDAEAYHGPLALYLDAGFHPYRETEHFLIVRRPLRDDGD